MIPNVGQFPEGQIIAFALILLRIIAFVMSCPIFSAANVPLPVRILFSLVLGMVVFPTIHYQNIDLINLNDQLIFLATRELFVGLALGFLMRMFFFAISIAGDLIGISMGLNAAQLFNPTLGSQSSVMENFELALATMFFLAINGHHVFISGLAQSFQILPISAVAIKTQGFASMGQVAHEVVMMGIKIASPVMVAIFLTNIAMGIIGRAVPQINVLVTSMPVTMLLGFVIMIVVTPLAVGEMTGMMNLMAERFFQFMRVM